MSIKRQSSFSHEQGSSLIEVLVSLLMVALGVLGVVTMQMNTLTNNREAFYRTQATVLAYDIIDRMRANRDQAISNGYLVAVGSSPTGTSCTTTCSPTQIATTDLIQWKDSIARQLPSGDGSVEAIAGVTESYRVVVQWDRQGENMSFDVGMRL